MAIMICENRGRLIPYLESRWELAIMICKNRGRLIPYIKSHWQLDTKITTWEQSLIKFTKTIDPFLYFSFSLYIDTAYKSNFSNHLKTVQ